MTDKERIKEAIGWAIFGTLQNDDAEAPIFGLYGVLNSLGVKSSEYAEYAKKEEFEIEDWQIKEYEDYCNLHKRAS